MELTEIFSGMPQGPETIQDNFQKMLDSFSDTGWATDGISFYNGAYDWGVKNSSDGTKSCAYRVVTIDKTKIVCFRAVFGINKAITNTSFFDAISFPKATATGSKEDISDWIPINNNAQIHQMNAGKIQVAAQPGVSTITANSMFSWKATIVLTKE